MTDDLFDESNLPTDTADEQPGGRRHYCPNCRKPLRRINGRKGPFWGCTGFPECTTSLFDNDGKPSEEPDERYRCPVCTRSMGRATNTKGDYWYCTGYNRGCKVVLPDVDGVPAAAWRCKVCGHLLKKRRGKNGDFWGCTQYPDCRQTYRDSEGKPLF
jgi:putative DNA topoisomerase